MKNSYWKVFVSCVIKHQDDLLVLKRRSNKYFGDYYDFPGGKMEFDESIEEAMIREVNEETGLTINSSNLKLKAGIDWKDEFESETRYAVCFCFLYEVDTKPLINISNEHSEYRWVKKDSPHLDDFLVNILNKCGI